MTEAREKYVVHNCLKTAYHSLRSLGRFVEGSHISPYQEFFEKVLNKKLDGEVPNSEVESYYLKKLTESDFVSGADSRLFDGNYGDSDLMERLLSTVWDIQSATHTNDGKYAEPGRQLWEIFLRLDQEGQLAVHIDDVCDLILRIFKSKGHDEQTDVIHGWFNNQETVQFWPFFSVLAENYEEFLLSPVVGDLYYMISTETIKEGRLTKKGHIMPNWKERWFTLTASALTYSEAKNTPVLKAIVINDKTAVQNMPESRAHLFRFRVLDGSSATPTEISSTEEFTMREWMAFIKLAVKMHQIEGRNFLHKYRLAINSFPKSFFSQASAIPTFTAAPVLPRVKKADSSHKGLMGTQSVSVINGHFTNDKALLQETDPTYDVIDGLVGSPPPVPSQHFERPLDYSSDDGMNKKRSEGKRGSGGRRRSSLDSSEIEHIRVDADLEYAVVTKAIKKKDSAEIAANQLKSDGAPEPPPRVSAANKKGRSINSPLPPLPLDSTPPQPPPHASILPQPPPRTFTPPQPPPQASTPVEPRTTPPPQPSPPRQSPGISKKAVSFDSSTPSSTTPHSSPVTTRKGYAELQFENGIINASNVSPLPERRKDVPNKFGYSKLKFETEEEIKRTKKPPPPPKYKGNMMKNVTESSLLNSDPQLSKGHKRTKPTSLPDLQGGQRKKDLDYAQVVFSNQPAVSPLIGHRILPPSDEQVPLKPPLADRRVEYATVILSPESKVKKNDKSRPDGYENFDLGPKKKSDYVNFDLNPSDKKGEGDYEICALTNSPMVAGSARLITSDPLQPKPRPPPRKGASASAVSPTQEKAPVPPARKTSAYT